MSLSAFTPSGVVRQRSIRRIRRWIDVPILEEDCNNLHKAIARLVKQIDHLKSLAGTRGWTAAVERALARAKREKRQLLNWFTNHTAPQVQPSIAGVEVVQPHDLTYELGDHDEPADA